jgi:hypothetical protein
MCAIVTHRKIMVQYHMDNHKHIAHGGYYEKLRPAFH